MFLQAALKVSGLTSVRNNYQLSKLCSLTIYVLCFTFTEGSDYNHPPFAPLIFEAGSNQECFNVSIISDNIAENTTSFSVGISSGVEAVGVRITGGRITVEIIDDG